MTDHPIVERRSVLAAALAFPLAFAPLARAAEPTGTGDGADAREVLRHAEGTIADLRKDKEFGNAQSLIRRTRGVLIVPRVFKAGFFFGGEGGSGVLLARSRAGWSNPAFYTMGSASFGLQIGAQEAEMIWMIQSERALQALMRSQFKVGADASLTVVTLGSNVGSGTSTSGTVADIVVWASSSGAFAGLAVDGTLIEPRDSYNTAFYGRPMTATEIVAGHQAANPAAVPLQHELARV